MAAVAPAGVRMGRRRDEAGMTNELLAALQPYLDRLAASAARDPALRDLLRAVGHVLLALTDAPAPPPAQEPPPLLRESAPAAAPPPAQERPPAPVMPPAPRAVEARPYSPPQVGDEDLPLIAARCRL